MEISVRRVLVSKRFLIPAASLILYSIIGFFIIPLAVRWYLPKFAQEQLKCQAAIGKVWINPLLFRVEIKDFSLKDQADSPLIGFERFYVDLGMSSIFKWAAVVSEFQLEKPMLNLVIEEDGTLNLSRLAPKSTEQKPEPQSTADSKPVRLLLRNLELTGGEIRITDKRQATAVVNFQDLNLNLKSLSTHLNQNGSYSLQAKTQGGESIEWQGDVDLIPFRSTGKVLFNGIQAATLWRFQQSSFNLEPPSGTLTLSTGYIIDTGNTPLQVALNDFKIDVSKVALKLSGADRLFFELGKLEFEGGLIELAARTIRTKKLRVDGGKLDVRFDEDGLSNLQKLVRKAPAESQQEGPVDKALPAVEAKPAPKQEAKIPAGDSAPPANEPPWKLSIDAIEVKNVAFELEDISRVSPLSAGVESFSFSTGVSIEAGQQLGVSARRMATEFKGVHFGAKGAPKPLFEAQSLKLEGEEVDLGARMLSISRIALHDGHFDVEIGEDGKSNIEKLMSPRPELAAQSKPKLTDSPGDSQSSVSEAPWKVNIDSVELKNIALGIEDLSRATPVSAAVGSISFNTKVNIEAGSKVELSAKELATELNGMRFGAKGAQKPLFEAQKLSLEGGEVNLGARSLSISRIALNDGHFDFGMGADGKPNIENLISPRSAIPAGSPVKASSAKRPAKLVAAKAQPKPAAEEPAKPGAIQGQPWSFLLKNFELNNFRSAISDSKVLPGKDLYALQSITVRVENIDGKSPMNFDVGLSVAQGGKVSLSGKVDPYSQSVDTRVNIAGLSLSPIQPYLDPFLTLQLQSALVSAQGTFGYGMPKKSKLVYEGSFGIDKLSLNQPKSKNPYLGWEKLSIPKLKMTLAPNLLQIPEIKLSKLQGELIIAEDHTVNLTKVVKEQPANKGAPTSAQKKSDEPFPFSIGKIWIADGNIAFADLSLRPKFMARIHQLKGSVSKLSMEKQTMTEIQLDGLVDRYGTAKVLGTVDLGDFKRSSDVNVVFKNVEMSSVSPYSGKFAGRRIKSGKISMDLNYKIQDHQLVGDNKIIVDNLVLGERVDSPDAVNLPLDLAITLLSDSNGRIDLGLPVSGDLDNPQFAVWPLVWKVFVNVMTKAATAPFRALGALFGEGTEKLESVEFEPGKTVIPPPEKEKLKKVSDVLQKKPQLKLVLQGRYSPEIDGIEMKKLKLRRALNEKMGIKSNAEEDLGPIDLEDSGTRRALEKIYVERFGSKNRDELDRAVKEGTIQPRVIQDESEQKSKKKKKNIFSRTMSSVKFYKVVPGAKSPDQQQIMAAEMYYRLVENESLDEKVLVQLATSRSAAVSEELLKVVGVPADRIDTKEPEPLADEPGVSAGLSVDVISGSP